MISYHRDTITVLRAALVDDGYGNEAPDWANPTRVDVTGCRLQPIPAEDYVLDREAVTTRWRLFAPPGIDLRATDRVEHNGAVYDVDGDPQRWPSPTGRLNHVEALLRRTEG
ncbi:phage head completion protein [Micromonospora chalcea]|uniref:phage head completion protein n=1 Tax=Micromonospora chalcea TaxID=1874 RepID=UPI003D70444B